MANKNWREQCSEKQRISQAGQYPGQGKLRFFTKGIFSQESAQEYSA